MIVFLAELDPVFLPEKDDEEQIAVKLHFFLESQNQIWCVRHDGEEWKCASSKCTCVAGKRAACHFAALMFYLENLKRQGIASIPSDKTVTDQLQQCQVPSKRYIQLQPVKDIQFITRELAAIYVVAKGHPKEWRV